MVDIIDKFVQISNIKTIQNKKKRRSKNVVRRNSKNNIFKPQIIQLIFLFIIILVIYMDWNDLFTHNSCFVNPEHTSSTIFQNNWFTTFVSKSEIDNSFHLVPIQNNDNISMKIEVSEENSEEHSDIKKKLVEKKQKKKLRLKKHKTQKKLNIRNIIPNLARKIIGYLCSDKSKQFLNRSFPNLSNQEIQKFYQYTNQIKSKLNFYIGNKDLKRIWYSSESSALILHITRILSKNFLNNEIISSILLSRRMKPALKIQHLHYRRKILRLLENFQYKIQ